MEQSNQAPCACLPDHLIAAVAEVAAKTGRGFDEALNAIILLGLEAVHEHSWAETSQLVKGMQLFLAEYDPNGMGTGEGETTTKAGEVPEGYIFDHTQQVFREGQRVIAGGHRGTVEQVTATPGGWLYLVKFPHGARLFLGDELQAAA